MTSRKTTVGPHGRAEAAFVELAAKFGREKAVRMMLAIMLKHGMNEVMARKAIVDAKEAIQSVRGGDQ